MKFIYEGITYNVPMAPKSETSYDELLVTMEKKLVSAGPLERGEDMHEKHTLFYLNKPNKHGFLAIPI